MAKQGDATTADTTSADAFDAVAAALVERGAKRARMMGRPMLSVNGKMFACLDGDVLGFKLGSGSDEHTRALGMPGADVFTPDKGRPGFKDWVGVPVDSAGEWEHFAVSAMEVVLPHE